MTRPRRCAFAAALMPDKSDLRIKGTAEAVTEVMSSHEDSSPSPRKEHPSSVQEHHQRRARPVAERRAGGAAQA
ncbi:hypothetical protein Ade02nite_77770 [Paractinoplanes deccanensis]|uniref:Uncharacterized protein n=1 Tax=Paractinoplanes deccanensis TaxID=113561 RepID=A0ABQ3YGL9_9ACTN|nr:hypothetical protein Ade02nite_77770 [Actinoplanes deccanensis]